MILNKLAKETVDWAIESISDVTRNTLSEKATKEVGTDVGTIVAKHLEDNDIVEQGVEEYKDYTKKLLHSKLGTSVVSKTLHEADPNFPKGLESFIDSEAENLHYLNQLRKLDPDGEIEVQIDKVLERKIGSFKDGFEIPDMDIDVEVDEELRKFIEPQIKNFSAAKQLSDTGFEHQVKIIQEAIKKHPLAKQFIKNYPTTMEEEIKDLPLEINKALREQNLKKLLDETSVKAPVYRTSTSRVNLTQESRFLNTTELGVHVGTSGQGDSLLAKKMLYENKNSSPEDTLKYTILKHGGENTVIDPITIPANTSAIKSKYYLNIKNPLIFPYEEPSSWSAHEILVEPSTLKTFEDVIRKNLKIKKGATYNKTQAQELKRLRKQAIDLTNYRQRFIDRTSIPAQNPDQRLRGRVKYKVVEDFAMWQLNLDFQKWLKSFGFDSIKYVNGVEPSYASDVDHLIDIDELHKQFKPTPFEQKQHLLDFDEPRHWSYIVFDPEQLKTTTAAKFDPKDPRHSYAKGGKLTARGIKHCA